MIDADRDGFIGMEDLREIHMNLGRQPSDDDLKKMLSESPGQLNFTSFLTLFGEKMHGKSCYNSLVFENLQVPVLKKMSVTFFLPQLLMLVESKQKQEGSKGLAFIIESAKTQNSILRKQNIENMQ